MRKPSLCIGLATALALPLGAAAETVQCHFTEEMLGEGAVQPADLVLTYILSGNGDVTVRIEATGVEVSGFVHDMPEGRRLTNAQDMDAGIDIMGNLLADGSATVTIFSPETGFGAFRGACTGMPTG